MTRGSRGFTLVEVALAVAIVAIGVLAVYSLLSTGMDAGGRAVAETHAATFADSVFGALRARSLQAAELQPMTQAKWEQFWEAFRNGTIGVPVAASNVWTGASTLWVYGGSVRTASCINLPFHAPTETGIQDRAMRYRANVALIYSSAQVLSNPDLISLNRARVVLFVWDGEFGSVEDTNALVFCTAFNNPGDL